jgi:aminopeptidase N
MTSAMSYAGGMGMVDNAMFGSQLIPDSYTPDSGNRGYVATSYDLTLDYRVASNRLAGDASISLVMQTTSTTVVLDLRGLTVSKVSVNGVRAAKFRQTRTKLTITLAQAATAGSHLTVNIQYSGNPRPNRSVWGEVGWEELNEGVLVASQPNGASSWFPCNDHPSNKARFRFDVTADSPYMVLANGTLSSKTVKSSRTRWVYESEAPMATYLATLQVGHYLPAELPHGNVALAGFIPADMAAPFAADFGDQQRMVEVFEEAFGPFPFDHYSVVVADEDLEIPLESQGIAVFGRNHVDGAHVEDRLIAHELAHSWFGNSLTVSSWRDIWLHEGFACYAEWLWSEKGRTDSAHTLATKYWARLAALPQDICIGDPGPDLMFDDRLYKRGALLVHTLRLSLGDDQFFSMLRAWTARHRHRNVTTSAFIEHAVEFGGAGMEPLISTWLFDLALPPLPEVAQVAQASTKPAPTTAKRQLRVQR